MAMAVTMSAEDLTRFFETDFPRAAEDYAVEATGEMTARLRFTPVPAHLRPGGTVSGPAIFALADVAFYAALLAQIGPVGLAVTTGASIDFMRKPAPGADLVAEARILKLGRRLAQGDVLVYSEGVAQPVARASMTYSIPPGP